MSRLRLWDTHAIPAAGTSTSDDFIGLADVSHLELFASFDYGSGGTSAKAYVQTSLDGGATWIDIACFAFAQADASKMSDVSANAVLLPSTVPTDGTLADDTVRDGVIGDKIRVKLIVVGTYANSTITVYAVAKQGTGGGATTITPISGSLTDRSGTITTGGTAQNAAAALSTRKYLYIENPITATARLWFSTVATAVADSPSISLEPGQSWENPSHFCPTGAVSVIAATTGHKFTVREA